MLWSGGNSAISGSGKLEMSAIMNGGGFAVGTDSGGRQRGKAAVSVAAGGRRGRQPTTWQGIEPAAWRNDEVPEFWRGYANAIRILARHWQRSTCAKKGFRLRKRPCMADLSKVGFGRLPRGGTSVPDPARPSGQGLAATGRLRHGSGLCLLARGSRRPQRALRRHARRRGRRSCSLCGTGDRPGAEPHPSPLLLTPEGVAAVVQPAALHRPDGRSIAPCTARRNRDRHD